MAKKKSKKNRSKSSSNLAPKHDAPKAPDVHPLLKTPDTLSLGEKLTIPEVYAEYVLPELTANSRARSTVSAVAREVRRWSEWWATQTSERLPIVKIHSRHLRLFRKWIAEQGGTVPTQNYAVRSVLQVLHCAEYAELITHSPKLRSLRHNGVAPKIFPSDDQLCQVWEAATKATWPRKDSSGRPLPYSPATAWRCALVLYRTYGFRTQELVRLEQRFRSLKWRNIHGPGITPNTEGSVASEFGWLDYVPQKQSWCKSHRHIVPLTYHARAALDLIGSYHNYDHPPGDQHICDWPLSSISFYATWHKIFDAAGVRPRAVSGVPHFRPKHMRKCATTMANNHLRGIGQHIVGHGADRSQQSQFESEVSNTHYDNVEHAVYDAISWMPMPACFDEILSSPVRRAG